MNKQLVVTREDLEIRARKLEIPVDIYQEGPIRYEFPKIGLSRLKVELNSHGHTDSMILIYLHDAKVLMATDTKKYVEEFSPESRFTQEFNSLLMRLIHGEDYSRLQQTYPDVKQILSLDDYAKLLLPRDLVNPGFKFNPYRLKLFKGELCQAIEGHLVGKPLPVGMNLIKIPAWLDEPEDPYAYRVDIDLSK